MLTAYWAGLQVPFGGRWDIPVIQTSEAGTPCDEEDSSDLPYVNAVVDMLAAEPELYNLSSVYVAGQSMVRCSLRLSRAALTGAMGRFTGRGGCGDSVGVTVTICVGNAGAGA